MTDNHTLLQKADLAMSDLTTNGGALLPEQAAEFIRKLIAQPTMVAQSRVVEMQASERKINKIGFGTRIMRKAVSAVALTSGQRSKPTTEQITMTTKEVIAEVRLPYDVLEDNIERGVSATNSAPNAPWSSGLQETLVTLIAERAALDLEELALLADTAFTSGDADEQDYLSLFNGWLKLAAGGSGNANDWGNAAIDKAMFLAAHKALPVQYLRNKGLMRHFLSTDQEANYRDTLANRGTALGDSYITGNAPVPAYGVPVEPVHLMPEAKSLFTNPKNLLFGIQRQVSMEFDKDITTRVYIVVLTARVAVTVEEVQATVLTTNIAS